MNCTTRATTRNRVLEFLLPILLAAGWLTLFCPTAGAQTSAQDRAAAEALFSEAGALYQQGRYPEACAKLADSQKLDPAVGTMLNLARCYEKMGRTATAWLTFLDAAAAAKRAHQQERESAARHAAEALAPSLPKLTIQVSETVAADKGEIKRDGTVLPSTLWNTSVPVDPGDHDIECTAPGKKPWSTRVRAEAGRLLTVAVPPLEDAPLPPAALGGSTPGSDEGAAAQAASARSTRRTLAVVAGGLGVVGIGVGTVLGLQAKADGDAVKEACPTKYCDDANLQRIESANQKATGSTIAFAVGGAALVAGVVLWLTAPSAPKAEGKGTALALTPSVARGGASLSLTGAW